MNEGYNVEGTLGVIEMLFLTRKNKSLRRGVTLVEVMMVLGVMAFILGIIMLVYALVNEASRSNQLIEEIYTVIDISNQLLASASNADGFNDQTIAQSGLMPSKWVSSQMLVSPFGSNVRVMGNGNFPQYTIMTNNISNEACIKISTTDFGESLLSRYPAPNDGGTEPLTSAEAAQQCAQNDRALIQLQFTAH